MVSSEGTHTWSISEDAFVCGLASLQMSTVQNSARCTVSQERAFASFFFMIIFADILYS